MLSKQVKARIRANKMRHRYRYKSNVVVSERDVSIGRGLLQPVFYLYTPKGPVIETTAYHVQAETDERNHAQQTSQSANSAQ